MPAFFAAYEAARGGSDIARAREIIDAFFTPNLESYRAAAVGRVDLARWITVFDPIASEVRRLAAGFAETWRGRVAAFRTALPDFSEDVPLTVLPSFLQFDAKTRLSQGRVHLFVGLDGAVALHGAGGNLAVLLTHECFHLYQHQVNPSLLYPQSDPLWLGIWMEGLAVYASGRLNPQADRRQVLLSDDRLVAATPDVLRRVAAELPGVLDRTDGSTRARYLSFDYRGDVPARSGYLVGLAIAERAGSGRTLAELARLPAPAARALVLAHVNEMGSR